MVTRKYSYYNDTDPFCCAWARELIKAELVPDGEVDERPIQDVSPEDLNGFIQCHFFSGILGWPYALRLAGWPSDRQIWTGSCPCPSFSAAGKGGGFADPRHLWPHWMWLISQCKPQCLAGEQVSSAIGYGWLDLVSADLEAEGYAVGSVVYGAHSVGAPHIRQRLYWVADTNKRRRGERGERGRLSGKLSGAGADESLPIEERGEDSVMADNQRGQCGEVGIRGRSETVQETGRRASIQLAGDCKVGIMGIANRSGSLPRYTPAATVGHGHPPDPTSTPSLVENPQCPSHPRLGQHGRSRVCVETPTGLAGSSSLSGFWRDAQWLYCRDQKYRPVESPIFPLADVVSNRVGMLRGAGNAIVPAQAAEFIKAYLDIENEDGGG